MSGPASEGEAWERVAGMLGEGRKVLGSHWTFNLWNDPKRLAFVLSRYKFAAKMACRGRSVLELGCSEGIGAPILAELATRYVGVDIDAPAIEAGARQLDGRPLRVRHRRLPRRVAGRVRECREPRRH